MNKVKIFTDSCPTPYQVTVNAGASTRTVLADSPCKAADLSRTFRAGILMSYHRHLGLNGLNAKDLIIQDFEGR